MNRVLIAPVALLPIAWLVGLAPFVWFLAAASAALFLIRTQNVRGIRYLPLWGVFLLFAVASTVQLDGPGAAAVWLMRFGWYLAAVLILLYVVNEDGDDTESVVLGSLFGLWSITIVGGWLALVFGDVSWPGVFLRVLPGAVSDNPYIQDLMTPRLNEAQTVGGELFHRPTAPFTYTNNWGSTLAILSPLGILAGIRRGGRTTARLTVLLTVAALPPLIVSLNRAAWLSLGVGLIYALWRLMRIGSGRAAGAAIAALAVGVSIALACGAAGNVADQLSVRSGDSTAARVSLYSEAIEAVTDSPIVGFGSPRASTTLDSAPPVGTQGQLWLVLFSHGVIAMAMYVGFFLLSFAVYPSHSLDLVLAKAGLLIAIVQIPIYGHLPQQLMIMMMIVGLLHRLSYGKPRESTQVDAPGRGFSQRHCSPVG